MGLQFQPSQPKISCSAWPTKAKILSVSSQGLFLTVKTQSKISSVSAGYRFLALSRSPICSIWVWSIQSMALSRLTSTGLQVQVYDVCLGSSSICGERRPGSADSWRSLRQSPPTLLVSSFSGISGIPEPEPEMSSTQIVGYYFFHDKFRVWILKTRIFENPKNPTRNFRVTRMPTHIYRSTWLGGQVASPKDKKGYSEITINPKLTISGVA